MTLISANRALAPETARMLEAFDCPAILVSPDYRVLATNSHYTAQFGDVQLERTPHCYQVSHGYSVPCDQAGEACPLSAAMSSGHKERVLHVHLTPRGKEHVDVEMMPILDDDGVLLCFVELLRSVATASAENASAMMVGASRAFNKMLEQITRVSRSDAAVLLLGPSGVGKELAAAAIHQGSDRRNKPLVTLECAGLTDSLFESELFGHVKGAFTGAHSNKTGLVEMADGGTLFLDEIGDVPLSMQVKLLRLLESGSYRPVGSAQVKAGNFRLICATHKDITAMVARGEFREDLFYRINVFPVRIPSLAERREDLPLLVKALISRISPDAHYHLTESAMKLLMAYDFPGNIRELRNLLTRAVVLSNTNLISADVMRDCLEMSVQSAPGVTISTHDSRGGNAESPWVDLKTAEFQYLQALMAAHGGDKAEVARKAGISLRSLYRKLERLD